MKSKDTLLLEEAYKQICEAHDETGSAFEADNAVALSPSSKYLLFRYDVDTLMKIWGTLKRDKTIRRIFLLVDKKDPNNKLSIALNDKIQKIEGVERMGRVIDELLRHSDRTEGRYAFVVNKDIKLPLHIVNRLEDATSIVS